MATPAYQRDYRARRRENGGSRLTTPVERKPEKRRRVDPKWPDAAGAAVARWSRKRLVVPPGHANAGQSLVLPRFAVEFIDDAMRPGVREAGCFVARKNAKSAAVAVLILAHLIEDGPLRRTGWRCGAASVSADKAVELWLQCRDIAEASDLEGVTFGKVPRHISSDHGRVDFLSADKTAGHASGFDVAIADELGLFPERGRNLVAGLLSSTSARDGRLIAISVLGDSPLSREMLERRGDPATVVHVHQAPADCALDDPVAWRAANPALGIVKSESYMADMARRAAANPSEQAAFRAFDLNQPGSPTREMIVALDRWQACEVHARPERAGPVFVGFDLGGSTSLTAAALFWPQAARLEIYGACGADPAIEARGQADGVGDRYRRMVDRGELRTWPGRVTPAGPFLAWIVELLAGVRPELAVADRYRQAEAKDALQAAGADWPMEWRAQGSGKDGSLQTCVRFSVPWSPDVLRPGESLLLTSAITESVLRYDGNGNPALDKVRAKGRIDALAAAVLAVGAGGRNESSNVHTIVHHEF